MLSVEEAFARMAALIEPVGLESVSLDRAAGRMLRRDVVAARTQPPTAVSAMDGYAVRAADARAGASLALVGRVAAGDQPGALIGPGETIRIFTGAPVPDGADAIALQEDVREEDARAVLGASVATGDWVRPGGGDFHKGAPLIAAPRRLRAEDVALAAAAGAVWLDVARRPRVVLLALGDELRRPGEATPPGAILSSNPYGVAALAEAAGADVSIAPIVPDDQPALEQAIAEAARGADLVATLGGASDGAHDLARPAMASLGAKLDFYKIAMRPGKPLSVGRLERTLLLGLPGNPVSSMVCARLFMIPAIAAMQGAPARLTEPLIGRLAEPLTEPNGPREHYMRAGLIWESGAARLRVFERQDSSLLSVLGQADALAIRPPHDPPRAVGAEMPYLPLS